MYFLVLLAALFACAAGVPFNNAKPTLSGRIEGGSPVPIEQHPYQVAVLVLGSLNCSGSIISPTCVVTAATCVVGIQPNFLSVRAGSTYHESGGSFHSVIGGYYHGSYNQNSFREYDVAVLRVDPPFTFSGSVQNIALQDSEIPFGTSVVVSGWGSTLPWLPINPFLLETVIPIRDYDACNNSFIGVVTDRLICAGPFSGFRGPCEGDTGGPLSTISFPPRLVGIVSWTLDCGNSFFPGIYTNVSAVRDWIINLCSAQIIPKEITKADAIL